MALAGRGSGVGNVAQLLGEQATPERLHGSSVSRQMLEELGEGECMCTKCTKTGTKLSCVDIKIVCADGMRKEGYFFVKCVRAHSAFPPCPCIA